MRGSAADGGPEPPAALVVIRTTSYGFVVGDLPRSSWKGTLHLRELVLPVGLASAKRKGDVELCRIHVDCGLRVGRQNVCPDHGPLTDDAVAPAWEISEGEYLELAAGELAAIAPRDTKTIDVYAVVAAGEIERLLTLRWHLLLPTRSRISRDGYALLEHAFRETDLAAIARFTAWGAEHLVALHGRAGVIELQELAPHSDLKDRVPIAELVDETVALLEPRTLQRATLLLERLQVPFSPELLRSLHRERVDTLVASKAASGNAKIIAPQMPELPAVSVDIGDAVERSLRAVPRARRARIDEALAAR